MTTSVDLVVAVTDEFEDELASALEYVEDRLIGEVPQILKEFSREVSRAYLASLADNGVALQLVADDGSPLPAPEDLTEEQQAEIDASMEEYDTWMKSEEGRAELASQERYFDLVESSKDETSVLYRAWLEEQAEEFALARQAWRADRRAELMARAEGNEVARS